MVTHMAFDRDLVSECLAGIRQHWDGLFCFGAPTASSSNVTKDAVWRDWAVSDSPNMKGTRSFTPSELGAMFGGDGELPTSFRVPTPRCAKHDLLSPEVEAIEIPGPVFTPADVHGTRSRTSRKLSATSRTASSFRCRGSLISP